MGAGKDENRAVDVLPKVLQMKYQQQVDNVLKAISEDSQIPVESLPLIGVTPEQIHRSIEQMIDKGMSLGAAEKAIITIWNKADPNAQAKPATPAEMILLGYKLSKGIWTHDIAKVAITDEERQLHSFRYAEQLAIHGLAQMQKHQP
jgi:hypothetical protein